MIPSEPLANRIEISTLSPLYCPGLPISRVTTLNDGRTGKEHHEVDKVAHFAENASSTLFAIVHPMVGRKVSGIDSVMQRKWLGDRSPRNAFICATMGAKRRLKPTISAGLCAPGISMYVRYDAS